MIRNTEKDEYKIVVFSEENLELFDFKMTFFLIMLSMFLSSFSSDPNDLIELMFMRMSSKAKLLHSSCSSCNFSTFYSRDVTYEYTNAERNPNTMRIRNSMLLYLNRKNSVPTYKMPSLMFVEMVPKCNYALICCVPVVII